MVMRTQCYGATTVRIVMHTTVGPELAIIGAMKCATTSLHRMLEQHDRICTGTLKEPNFFAADDKWAQGTAWYRELWAPEPGQLRLDSSPNYTKRHLWPDAARRMASITPEARLVYIVREPLERIVSHHLHLVASGREVRSFATVMRDLDNPLVATTRYAWQLEPWLEAFARDQLLVLRADELQARPRDTVARVLEFAGVDPEVDLDEVQAHRSDDKGRPSALARAIGSRRARDGLRRLHPRLADRPLPSVDVDPELAARIRGALRADLRQLHATGLVDVSDWLDASPASGSVA